MRVARVLEGLGDVPGPWCCCDPHLPRDTRGELQGRGPQWALTSPEASEEVPGAWEAGTGVDRPWRVGGGGLVGTAWHRGQEGVSARDSLCVPRPSHLSGLQFLHLCNGDSKAGAHACRGETGVRLEQSCDGIHCHIPGA